MQQQISDKQRSIIQQMIDNNDPEDDIKMMIESFGGEPKPNRVADVKPPPTMLKGEPTTFWGGFGKSITSGESSKASLDSLLGFAKGAVLDIPSSIVGGLKTIGGLVTNPVETGKELMKVPGQMWDTAKQAGSNPEAFGRMMGNVGGQPLVTAGLSKVLPPVASGAAKMAGKPLEVIGRTIAENGSVTGFMPPMAVPKYFKIADKMMGGAVEKLGKKLQAPAKVETPNFSSTGNQPAPGIAGRGKSFGVSGNESNLTIERPANPNPASVTGQPNNPMFGNNPTSNIMPVNIPEPVNPAITASMSGQPINTPNPTNIPFSNPSMSSNLTNIGASIANPTEDINAMMKQLGNNGNDLNIVPHDDMILQNNGSGESSASLEAISRQKSMGNRGEQYVVYDRGGNMKPLIGPEAVDYKVRPGESYGILGPKGQFTLLDDAGGISPNKLERPSIKTPQTVYVKKLTPEIAKELLQKGYKFDSMREDGAYKMIKSSRPPKLN